jgi:hypothetical protein
MTNRIARALTLLVVLSALVGAAWAQAPSGVEDLEQGRHLAILICANCHVVAPEQIIEPILRPPAPSFESIAQRSTTNLETLRNFLITTHRDSANRKGMPNPELLDYQIGQVTAYLLSLRKTSSDGLDKPIADNLRKPSSSLGSCRAEIDRLELVLKQARSNGQPLGGATESSAALRHRQPTTESVAKAAAESENTVETALSLARKLDAEGMDAECAAMLKKVELSSGLP